MMKQKRGIKDLEKEIEIIEEERVVLHDNEMWIDERCDKIIMSLVNKIGVYVILMTVGSVCGVLFSSKRILHPLVGIIAIIFLMCVGLSTFLAFHKLKKIQPTTNEIKGRKEKLNKMVCEMLNLLNNAYGSEVDIELNEAISFACTRVALIGNALQNKSGGFRKDNTDYLMFICIASVVFPLSIIPWTFYTG